MSLEELAAYCAHEYGRAILDDWLSLSEILWSHDRPHEDEDIQKFHDLIASELVP